MSLLRALERLETASRLDRPASAVRDLVRRTIPPGRIRDLLHGLPLGHPVHPVLVQVPTGAFVSAAVLDVCGWDLPARRLVQLGLVTSVPAVVAGATDWSELHEQQLRVGLVHATGNAGALVLYASSLVARTRGHRGAGRVLGLLGLSVLGLAGAVGGHLAYRQAAGVNHAEHVPHVVEPGWHDLGAVGDLDGATLQRRAVGETPVVVVRDGAAVHVLADRCTHLSGPLSDGTLTAGPDGSSCVVCPWHGSTFRLRDGTVAHGPATAPQPAFETRTRDGRLEARLPGAG